MLTFAVVKSESMWYSGVMTHSCDSTGHGPWAAPRREKRRFGKCEFFGALCSCLALIIPLLFWVVPRLLGITHLIHNLCLDLQQHWPYTYTYRAGGNARPVDRHVRSITQCPAAVPYVSRPPLRTVSCCCGRSSFISCGPPPTLLCLHPQLHEEYTKEEQAPNSQTKSVTLREVSSVLQKITDRHDLHTRLLSPTQLHT